jgi:hypothetical protein
MAQMRKSGPAKPAYKAGAAKKSAPIKVSQAMIDKVKADGMQTAIKKAASSRQSPEYTKAVVRMYGEKRIQNAYLKYYQPGKAVPNTGAKTPSLAQAAKELIVNDTIKAVKNIPKIPGAAAKTLAQKARKPGRNY